MSWPAGALTVGAWLAQDPPKPPRGPEFGGSSPIGLVVILLLFIAVVFLIRSMTKHLRKVPDSFDQPAEAEPAEDGTEADQQRPAGGTESSAERPCEQPANRSNGTGQPNETEPSNGSGPSHETDRSTDIARANGTEQANGTAGPQAPPKS